MVFYPKPFNFEIIVNNNHCKAKKYLSSNSYNLTFATLESAARYLAIFIRLLCDFSLWVNLNRICRTFWFLSLKSARACFPYELKDKFIFSYFTSRRSPKSQTQTKIHSGNNLSNRLFCLLSSHCESCNETFNFSKIVHFPIVRNLFENSWQNAVSINSSKCKSSRNSPQALISGHEKSIQRRFGNNAALL